MSSVRNTTLLQAIQLDIDAKKWFWYGGMQGAINTRVGEQHVLRAPASGYPPELIHADNIDCCHPYWQTHRLERLTPNAAWHRPNWPWTGGIQVVNCSMLLHPSIQCSGSYAPDSATHFRLFWLNQRMLQVRVAVVSCCVLCLVTLMLRRRCRTSSTRRSSGCSGWNNWLPVRPGKGSATAARCESVAGAGSHSWNHFCVNCFGVGRAALYSTFT